MIYSFVAQIIFWLCGVFLFFKIPSFRKYFIGVRPDKIPSFSIIIPARNEEKTISRVLTSLINQKLVPNEIIVVDDNSIDRTFHLAESFGVEVIHSEPLPEGWTGKSWACWQGALKSNCEILLFLDADTWLEPDGLERIIHEYIKNGGLLTIQPYHVTKKYYEQLSLFFNMILMAGTNAFTPLGEKINPGASFGPCVVCRREDYFKVGGHQAIKSYILEDIAIGQLFVKNNFPLHCYAGKGAISFRMYEEGLTQLITGWSKSMAQGAASISPLFLLISIGWITGFFNVTISLIKTAFFQNFENIIVVSSIYIAYSAQLIWIMRRIGHFKLLAAIFFPIPLIFFTLIMLRSLIMVNLLGNVVWKGRKINTSERKINS